MAATTDAASRMPAKVMDPAVSKGDAELGRADHATA